MTKKSDEILKIRGVKKSFGNVKVLDGINLTIHKQEVVVLIGSSGSGKSTLLRTINLLERIDDGQIFLYDEDITDPRQNADSIRSKIGIVFQSFNLFPHLSVLRNVSLANISVNKMKKEEADKISTELLKKIGLIDKLKVHPDRLSGGQQQRVAIVRAIATRPKLLLLDEITSALDPQLVGEVLDLVLELKREGYTILMATHEMGFAKKIADRICFLNNGKILEEGTVDQIFNKPKHEKTREFLSKIV